MKQLVRRRLELSRFCFFFPWVVNPEEYLRWPEEIQREVPSAIEGKLVAPRV